MRGGRAEDEGPFRARSLTDRDDRRPPGRSSRTDSSSARMAAQLTHMTPRSNGRRDCGRAGYGCAPVNRRRRPVTEAGVRARFDESLIALPRRQRPRRTRDARRPTPMTTRRARRAPRSMSVDRVSSGAVPARSRRRTGSRRFARRDRYWWADRRFGRGARASPTRRRRHLRR